MEQETAKTKRMTTLNKLHLALELFLVLSPLLFTAYYKMQAATDTLCIGLVAGTSTQIRPFDNDTKVTVMTDNDAVLVVSRPGFETWKSPKPECRSRSSNFKCQPNKATLRLIEAWSSGRVELRAKPQFIKAETVRPVFLCGDTPLTQEADLRVSWELGAAMRH